MNRTSTWLMLLCVTSTLTSACGPPPGELTILSLNLHCLKTGGTPYATNEARFDALVRRAATERVDAMALQEVCKSPRGDALEMIRSRLEAHTGERWSSHWVFAHIGWEGTPQQSDEGVAVLARGELRERGELVHRSNPGLRRAAACATLPDALGGVRLCSAHFDHQHAGARVEQARELATWARTNPSPNRSVVIAGDYNANPQSRTYSELVLAGYVDASEPLPRWRIDHVFVGKESPWRRADTNGAALLFWGDGEQKLSDHPGVRVRLRR